MAFTIRGKPLKNVIFLTVFLSGIGVTASTIGAVTKEGHDLTRLEHLELEVKQLISKMEELNFLVLRMQVQIDDLHQLLLTKADRIELENSHSSLEMTQKPATMSAHSVDGAASLPSGMKQRIAVTQGGNPLLHVPKTETASELYQIGYQHILSGDYRAAETVFQAFIERYSKGVNKGDPKIEDPKLGAAYFWLGEALYGQEKYLEAAQMYLYVQKHYKGAENGPENLLKLGMSMAMLDKKNIACATLTEIAKTYPHAEPAVLQRTEAERRHLQCP